MRSVRVVAAAVGALIGLAGMVGVSGNAALEADAMQAASPLPTYTGVYEVYATIALVAVKPWESQGILKTGRPPPYADVSRVASQAEGLIGQRVRAFGRYATDTPAFGSRPVRYMVVQRIVRFP